jgi:quinoprotein glucose dehydrogenase
VAAGGDDQVLDGRPTGTLNLGGPIMTGGGLVFTAAAMDDQLRAFDSETGRQLWKFALPAGGQATPMTYSLDGKQLPSGTSHRLSPENRSTAASVPHGGGLHGRRLGASSGTRDMP